jgi:hypothetical protein
MPRNIARAIGNCGSPALKIGHSSNPIIAMVSAPNIT